MHHYTHLQYTNLGFASIFYQDKKFTISFAQIIEYQEMLPRAIESRGNIVEFQRQRHSRKLASSIALEKGTHHMVAAQ